jgi:hypothetical protein
MNPINQMNQKNQTDQKNQMNQIGREPQLRVSQSRGSRGVDAQATMRLTTRGRVRLGLLQNHVAIGFSGVNPRQ